MPKTKNDQPKRVFTKFHCPKCDKYLGEIPVGSSSYCCKCNKWMKAGDTDESD